MKNTKSRTEYLKPLSILIKISEPVLAGESGVTKPDPTVIGAKGNNFGNNENIDDKELPGFNAWETWE